MNLGVHNGTLVQLQRSRPWLLKIHWINHRIELAVKSAFDVPMLKAVDEFYTTNYYLSMSGSNSSVERTFSFVTNILFDKRLSMSHDTLENSVIVSGKNSIWSEKEREEITDRAFEIYLSKCRITTLSSEADSAEQLPDSDDGHEIDEHDEDDLDSEDERLVDELMVLMLTMIPVMLVTQTNK